MRSIEIPQPDERGLLYRFFEALPALLTWTILLLPLILGLTSPKTAAYFIIFYILIWFFRAIGLNVRALQGYRLMSQHRRFPWAEMNQDLEALQPRTAGAPGWHARNIARVEERIGHNRIKPSQVYHAVMICFYNESRDVLQPTVQSVINSDYDTKKLILVLAYEERGGPEIEKLAHDLVKEYGQHFHCAEAVKHPADMPGEIVGKGGNATFGGRRLHKILDEQKINPEHVLVTVLDSDNRPDKAYFGALTYTYCSTEEPRHASYQPIPMFTNNIWDAPAPMRVIATGNSYWMVVLSMRQHILRNFSAHAQPMSALIDTDFWSVRTIVEDGHQFWRTYFRYDGNHHVFPIYVPIYQDAVLAGTMKGTLKAQFIQLRRWAWGASDIAYVAYTGWFKPNKVPRRDLLAKWFRLLEGHVSWSTAPLIIAFAALIPVLLNPQSFIANELPQVVSKMETVALIGVIITMFVSLKTLPPRPERYKRRRNFWMMVQWVYLLITPIIYSSTAAIYSQTRLAVGWYIGKFDVTEKAVKK